MTLGIACAAAGLLDVGGGAEDLAFGGVGLGCHTRQFLLDHAELAEELVEGFALGCIGRRHVQCGARATNGSGAQLQTTDIEDIEGDLVALVDLTEQVFDWYL